MSARPLASADAGLLDAAVTVDLFGIESSALEGFLLDPEAVGDSIDVCAFEVPLQLQDDIVAPEASLVATLSPRATVVEDVLPALTDPLQKLKAHGLSAMVELNNEQSCSDVRSLTAMPVGVEEACRGYEAKLRVDVTLVAVVAELERERWDTVFAMTLGGGHWRVFPGCGDPRWPRRRQERGDRGLQLLADRASHSKGSGGFGRVYSSSFQTCSFGERHGRSDTLRCRGSPIQGNVSGRVWSGPLVENSSASDVPRDVVDEALMAEMGRLGFFRGPDGSWLHDPGSIGPAVDPVELLRASAFSEADGPIQCDDRGSLVHRSERRRLKLRNRQLVAE